MAGRVLAVRVHVDVAEPDARAGAQQFAGIGIEDVGVAPDFVHRPAAAKPGPAPPGTSTPISAWWKMNRPPTVFARARLALLIVDFPDFDRRRRIDPR